MTQSELITLWYELFCILKKKPDISYATFSSLMKKNNYNTEEAIKEFKDKYC